MQRKYDITSGESLRAFAQQLKGKNLSQVVQELPENAYKKSNKGGLGSMVEKYFYEFVPGPNKNHEPDFDEAGVELKVTGVLKKKPKIIKEAPYKAKERLVLTMINYRTLINETWKESSLLKKCRLMLILFYLYEKDVPIAHRKFVMDPMLWDFPEADLEIIKKDWLEIQKKVYTGQAHTLSEGDTFYLGACRKGSGKPSDRREQPCSDIPAKSRAFSLKTSYVNTIIDATWNKSTLLKDKKDAKRGIEQIALEKFDGLSGKTAKEIASLYNFPLGESQAKNKLATLSLRILGTKKRQLPEFQKADIELKTIRLKKSGTPQEAISFPTMDFNMIINQKWEETSFWEKINRKFFFVVYQYDENDILHFKKAMFWNMPYEDRLEAEKVWKKAVKVIKKGEMKKLPKISESEVAHVRPHGRNKADTAPLPNGGEFTKQSFWLNPLYIARQIEIETTTNT